MKMTGITTIDECEAKLRAIDEIPAMIEALEALCDPQNFRADPTVQTLNRRDKALNKARAILRRIEGGE